MTRPDRTRSSSTSRRGWPCCSPVPRRALVGGPRAVPGVGPGPDGPRTGVGRLHDSRRRHRCHADPLLVDREATRTVEVGEVEPGAQQSRKCVLDGVRAASSTPTTRQMRAPAASAPTPRRDVSQQLSRNCTGFARSGAVPGQVWENRSPRIAALEHGILHSPNPAHHAAGVSVRRLRRAPASGRRRGCRRSPRARTRAARCRRRRTR